MNKEIEHIIFNLECCCGMFDYILTPIENNLLVSHIKELHQETKQLKEKVEWYENENKHNQEIIIKDAKVLSEIREYIDGVITIWKTNPSAIATLDLEYLLQQIDKVKE